jgi:hypothetical protein
MLRAAYASVLALVGVVTSPERKSEGRARIDEVIHPWSESIVDTPTPPTGPRRIDVSQWEDLIRASELLGRPILRLHGGEGGAEGRLFYVADGPQSYVFGFGGSSLNVTRSGGYAPPAPPVILPAPPPEIVEVQELVIPAAPVPAPVPAKPDTTLPRPAPSAEVPDLADQLLGPEIFDEKPDAELPTDTVVERRIREMIHELLADFRKLPAGSDSLEMGTEHIQRAIDMLHLGRYGTAQIELNKASRLLKDEPAS